MLPQSKSSEIDSVSGRDNKVDILKGVLVVLMVFFHCASMVVARRPNLAPILEHLSFLHLSFLVTSGFVVGIHYIPLVESREPSQVRSRMRWRGFRLLCTFIIINIGAYGTGVLPIQQLCDVFLKPRGAVNRLLLFPDGNIYATEVLLHIAVFLLLVSFTLRKEATKLAIISAFGCLALVQFSGLFSSSAAGFIGVALAAVYRSFRTTNVENSILRRFSAFVLLFGGLLLPWVRKLEGWSMLTLVVVIILNSVAYTALCFLVVVGTLPLLRHYRIDKVLIPFGRYTLFAYVWQMVLIRIVARIFSTYSFGGWEEYVYSVCVVVVATGTSILILGRLRSEYSWMDKVYKAAFE